MKQQLYSIIKQIRMVDKKKEKHTVCLKWKVYVGWKGGLDTLKKNIVWGQTATALNMHMIFHTDISRSDSCLQNLKRQRVVVLWLHKEAGLNMSGTSNLNLRSDGQKSNARLSSLTWFLYLLAYL